MKNQDKAAMTYEEMQKNLMNAIESGESEDFAKAQVQIAKDIEARILEEAKTAIHDDINDNAVMTKRGLNPLTTEEKTYYNEVIGTGGFDGTEQLVPATVFERVFEYLRANHQLLQEITMVNTTGVTEWVTRNNDVAAAWWGTLSAAIEKELSMAFKRETTNLYKLSAYIPVSKAMLELGPQWLDRFVREVLAESMAMALELAIVAGTGKNEPIGMQKDLEGAVVDGVYPDKTPTAITDLDPVTLGTQIMGPLTKGGKRAVNNVLLIVNPLDYWSKIFPNTTFLTADKTYVHGVLPIPAKVVQSVAVTEGTMVAGMAKDYFMGVGSARKIDYSDHYRFLEDERTYISKQYANGKPQDNDSFLYFDISGITAPAV